MTARIKVSRRPDEALYGGDTDDGNRQAFHYWMGLARDDWIEFVGEDIARRFVPQLEARAIQRVTANERQLALAERKGIAHNDGYNDFFINYRIDCRLPRRICDRLLRAARVGAIRYARLIGHQEFLRYLSGGNESVFSHHFSVELGPPDFTFSNRRQRSSDSHTRKLHEACTPLRRILHRAVERDAARYDRVTRDLLHSRNTDADIADIIGEFAGFKARVRRCKHSQLRNAQRFVQAGRPRLKGVCAACGARVNRFAPLKAR